MSLKALLVDDEIHILNNLSQVLPWEAMGFEIVGLAKNGVDALEAAGKHHPDLILSDIRMPMMDGITFIQKVREQGLKSEVLLLTGYQEFDYARSAIRFGVRDYICKPINYFELEDTVRKIAEQIKHKQVEKSKELRFSKVVSWANENHLLQSLLGLESKQDEALWDNEEELRGQRYLLLLIDIDGYSRESIYWSVEDRKSWNFHIKNLLKELFIPVVDNYTVLQIREGEWCLIFRESLAGWGLSEAQLEESYERLSILISEKSSLSIRMCLQNAVSTQEMSSVYQRMQQLLIIIPHSQQQWLFDMGMMLTEQEEPGSEHIESQLPGRLIEHFSHGLRGGSLDELTEATAELKQYVGHLSENRLGRAQKLLHYLLIHLLREMRELQILSAEQEEKVWLRFQESLSLKELLSLVVFLIEQSSEPLVTKKTSEKLMASAENYIQHHLGSDFGIDEIADYLGISCSYFCLLFKNHFGETFVEHLTRQRIEMAKRQLITTERSVTQIGALVGYQERRYFTKVFQKYTGMTPSEYRSKDSPIS